MDVLGIKNQRNITPWNWDDDIQTVTTMNWNNSPNTYTPPHSKTTNVKNKYIISQMNEAVYQGSKIYARKETESGNDYVKKIIQISMPACDSKSKASLGIQLKSLIRAYINYGFDSREYKKDFNIFVNFIMTYHRNK